MGDLYRTTNNLDTDISLSLLWFNICFQLFIYYRLVQISDARRDMHVMAYVTNATSLAVMYINIDYTRLRVIPWKWSYILIGTRMKRKISTSIQTSIESGMGIRIGEDRSVEPDILRFEVWCCWYDALYSKLNIVGCDKSHV